MSTQRRYTPLFEDGQLGPFPMDRLKRVDKPTTLITDSVQRIGFREMPLVKAALGDYGPAVQKEANRAKKEPITHALREVLLELSPMRDGHVAGSKAPIVEDPEVDFIHKIFQFPPIKDDRVAAPKAPIPEDPVILTRHIKSLGYFLGADIVGVCRIPEYARYSHDHERNPINPDYQFAIVIVVGKHYPTVKASTGYDWIVDAISYQAYLRSAFISRPIAQYIKSLGYPASA